MGATMQNDGKKQDARFLVEEFGVLPQNAAALVHSDNAEALASELLREEREADALAGVPVPGSGKDPEHEERSIKDLEKPVVRRGPAEP